MVEEDPLEELKQYEENMTEKFSLEFEKFIEESSVCYECDKTFHNNKSLKTHKYDVHADEEKKHVQFVIKC